MRIVLDNVPDTPISPLSRCSRRRRRRRCLFERGSAECSSADPRPPPARCVWPAMTPGSSRDASRDQARVTLAARLRNRLPEIEKAAVARVFAISDPAAIADPMYADGLRVSVGAAVEYALAAVEHGEERAPPLPPILLAQARLAARNGVGLDTVLRRYFAGYTLLADFLAGEAETVGLPTGTVPAHLMTGHAALFERLIAAVSEQYEREAAARRRSSDEHRAERVQRLLDGELLDTSELRYDFSSHHLGLVASGSGAAEALRTLAASLDCRLLLVRPEENLAWAWLGTRHRLDPERLLSTSSRPQVPMAVGETAQGLAGWRLTHHQAEAALPLALRSAGRWARYSDVALLASALRDQLLVDSLHRLYVEPLEGVRDGGRILRETLRAYFAADRNVSSTAKALGVNRKTVTSRLRTVESLIGRSLAGCAGEVETALSLDEITGGG